MKPHVAANIIALIAGTLPLAFAACNERSTGPGENAPLEAVEKFVDRAAETGLVFHHFNGMSGQYYFCEPVGPGGALFDYDNDGDLDIYIVQGNVLGSETSVGAVSEPELSRPMSDRLYENQLQREADGSRTLRFRDITGTAQIDCREYGMGVAAGDYDNDGWIDLYVTNFGPNNLLHNNGDRTFTDVTSRTGVDDRRWSTSAAFLDFDRDGWLDLFVCNYVNFTLLNHKECYSPTSARDYCGPLSYQPAPDSLFHNRNGTRFENASTSARIVREYGGALGVVCTDLNGDEWVDIYVANDGLANQLWINQHDGTFRNDALLAGCAYNGDGVAEASMGVDAADFDDDGDQDLFMTHLRDETNTLYVNDGRGHFRDHTNESALAATSRAFTGFGTAWFDYDNDGWLDLFVANGEVRTIEALARQGDPYPLHQPNQLFRNLGNGRFSDLTASAGRAFALSEVSRGTAVGDVDNDGDVDVLVLNNNGPARLFLNQIGDRQPWLGLRFIHPRLKRDMVGTRVQIVRKRGSSLWRHVRVAASYCSSHDPRILVGLGPEAAVTAVRAHWPDGRIEEWPGPALSRWSTLTYGSGTPIKEREH